MDYQDFKKIVIFRLGLTPSNDKTTNLLNECIQYAYSHKMSVENTCKVILSKRKELLQVF